MEARFTDGPVDTDIGPWSHRLLHGVALRFQAGAESLLEECRLLVDGRLLLGRGLLLLRGGLFLRLRIGLTFLPAASHRTHGSANRCALAGVIVGHLANDGARGGASRSAANALT